jgi:hypothetical protein
VVRELIDGAAGRQTGNRKLPSLDEAAWQARRDRLELVARQADHQLDSP